MFSHRLPPGALTNLLLDRAFGPSTIDARRQRPIGMAPTVPQIQGPGNFSFRSATAQNQKAQKIERCLDIYRHATDHQDYTNPGVEFNSAWWECRPQGIAGLPRTWLSSVGLLAGQRIPVWRRVPESCVKSVLDYNTSVVETWWGLNCVWRPRFKNRNRHRCQGGSKSESPANQRRRERSIVSPSSIRTFTFGRTIPLFRGPKKP